jgi:hypothetical protein
VGLNQLHLILEYRLTGYDAIDKALVSRLKRVSGKTDAFVHGVICLPSYIHLNCQHCPPSLLSQRIPLSGLTARCASLLLPAVTLNVSDKQFLLHQP